MHWPAPASSFKSIFSGRHLFPLPAVCVESFVSFANIQTFTIYSCKFLCPLWQIIKGACDRHSLHSVDLSKRLSIAAKRCMKILVLRQDLPEHSSNLCEFARVVTDGTWAYRAQMCRLHGLTTQANITVALFTSGRSQRQSSSTAAHFNIIIPVTCAEWGERLRGHTV
jgi:hypothetical protein